ncbi:MAG: hypothetical protein ACKPKO_65905, partial [Candidatus Fonsibacter sp.]
MITQRLLLRARSAEVSRFGARGPAFAKGLARQFTLAPGASELTFTLRRWQELVVLDKSHPEFVLAISMENPKRRSRPMGSFLTARST